MNIPFVKYHGAGNDFVIIDSRKLDIDFNHKLVELICNRRLGIGADGLILLNTSTENEVDFSMKYFNSDGFESTMCGNGGRCITAFANYLNIINEKAIFNAIDGLHYSEILKNEQQKSLFIKLKMIDVENIVIIEDDYFLNTGSPHFVVFVDNAKNADVEGMGKMLRNDKRFKPDGANINFVSFSNGRLFVRTYERGVEAETLSCGTGVTASVLATVLRLDLPFEKINVDTLGGQFEVTFKRNENSFSNIWLHGPVVRVFEGVFCV